LVSGTRSPAAVVRAPACSSFSTMQLAQVLRLSEFNAPSCSPRRRHTLSASALSSWGGGGAQGRREWGGGVLGERTGTPPPPPPPPPHTHTRTHTHKPPPHSLYSKRPAHNPEECRGSTDGTPTGTREGQRERRRPALPDPRRPKTGHHGQARASCLRPLDPPPARWRQHPGRTQRPPTRPL
jgi:hypothetical protein